MSTKTAVPTVIVKGREIVVPKRKPKPTSERKRPNRAFIEKCVAFRGHMTGNEKSLLTGLEVKNALARINTRAMADDVTVNFDGTQNAKLQALMKAFVKGVDEVLKGE